jgi:hypothetical protein
MPVRVTTARNKYDFIYPTTTWQRMSIGKMNPEEFKVEEDRFYVTLRLGWSYVDPRLQVEGGGRGSWF